MQLPIELVVNSAADAAPELQCLYMQVNKASIRTELVNNRLHLVIPSYTLPDNIIMNGGLYPHAEIEANYKQLENTLAPLGHPVVNGKHVSAKDPEAIAAYHVGAFNRNVQRRGNRIYLEKFVDVEYAANSAKGRQLLEAVGYDAETQKLTPTETPIHTSVAAYVAKELTPNAEGHKWVARISMIDHDAILIGEPGAATPEQGVGLMVNVADASQLQANAGVLGDGSYNNRQSALSQAANARWEDSWVQDFDDATAIVRMRDGESKAVAYSYSGRKVQFADESTPVKREESWVVNQINRICQSLGLAVHSEASAPEPIKPSPEADPMLTKEEIAAMLKEHGETLAANMAEAIKPLGDRLDGLEANLQANADATAKPKREAVAKVIGELAANKLSGAELDEAFSKLQANSGTAVPLIPGFQANADEAVKGAPAVDEYFNK